MKQIIINEHCLQSTSLPVEKGAQPKAVFPNGTPETKNGLATNNTRRNPELTHPTKTVLSQENKNNSNQPKWVDSNGTLR